MTIPGLTLPPAAAPTLTLAASKRRWKHLWLKYVRDVNLDKHCARGLSGPYSRLIGPGVTTVDARPLAEFPAPAAFYLCGVTQYPWRLADNAHCAFVYEPGSEIRYTSPSGELTALIRDARQLPISADDIDPTHPRAGVKEYGQCRNWQFAHRFAADRDGRRPASVADVDWAARMLEPPA